MRQKYYTLWYEANVCSKNAHLKSEEKKKPKWTKGFHTLNDKTLIPVDCSKLHMYIVIFSATTEENYEAID